MRTDNNIYIKCDKCKTLNVFRFGVGEEKFKCFKCGEKF